MRRVDFTDPRTRELQFALADVFTSEEAVNALLENAGISPALYPRRAKNQRAAWQMMLHDFAHEDTEKLLRAVVADPANAAVKKIADDFLSEERLSAGRAAREDLEAPATLLREVFSSRLGAGAQRRARELAARLGVRHAGEQLFEVTRLAVEYHLMKAEELSASLIVDLAESRREDELDELSQLIAAATSLRDIELRVDHAFFSRTIERRGDWTTYFEAVAKLRPHDPHATTTLFRIRAKGFVAPQFLVAGLLAEFDDDWNPIINEYERQIDATSAFASYQTSLWNTWLLWGPSIPICSCEQWQGLYAHQYGYGDEDNTLPITFTAQTGDVPFPQQRPGAAILSRVVGRLRWAPLALRSSLQDLDASGEIECVEAPVVAMARAQRILYTRTKQGQTGEAAYVRPLLFQGEELRGGAVPERSYFSAYQWLMFLVARTPSGEAMLPRRLDLEAFPGPKAPRVERVARRLWRDLVPVYVHANIADADALALQRRALIRNAISTLRHLWEEREHLFPRVPAEELRFYLVGGSDFSGCGKPVRFAPPESLVAGLRTSLSRKDTAFRETVLIPADGAVPPDALARFYATCQLPELVEDYFEYVRDLREP